MDLWLTAHEIMPTIGVQNQLLKSFQALLCTVPSKVATKAALGEHTRLLSYMLKKSKFLLLIVYTGIEDSRLIQSCIKGEKELR